MASFDSQIRAAGLLAPVFALRHSSDFGIGDTRAVRDAIEFCARQGFAVLQILPVHETIGDYSPYNPVSSRALSPSLLSLTPAEVPGLSEGMLHRLAPETWLGQLRQGPVKHGAVHSLKLQVLLAAHRNFQQAADIPATSHEEFDAFQTANADWLPAWTLYRLLVREYDGNACWSEWRPEHQSLPAAERWWEEDPDRLHRQRLREGLAFVQWVGWRQWKAVRRHAEDHGVRLLGEISFGVSRNSADAWARPELFDFDWNMGTPPLAFFDTNKDSERFGQNWGFPPYRWESHRREDFAWLRARLAGERQFFHLCRVDHLRGYFRAYMFPWGGGAQHAEFSQLTPEEILQRAGGRWPRFIPGDDLESAAINEVQGRELIGTMRQAAGDMFLIGEIMGELPDYMSRVLEDLQVASLTFPQLERNADRSLRPPSSYRRLSMVSFANHDHPPLAALYTHLREQVALAAQRTTLLDFANLLHLAGWNDGTPPEFNDALLAGWQRFLFSTPCFLATLMTSDLLGIPQRFNLPGSFGQHTWNARLERPLADYESDPIYGPRLARVRMLLAETGRAHP